MAKFFIITCGPTGSGKTKLVEATLKELGLECAPYQSFLIDDLVENDADYKDLVSKIIQQIDEECKGDVACEESKFDNPSPELFKQFNDAYYSVRNGKSGIGCQDLRDEGANCNEVLDSRIKNISQTTPPIVVFETKGTYIPEWLLHREWIPEGYKVIVSYSLVSLKNLVERNKRRAYQGVQKFKMDKSNPAPRLPDVSEKSFIESVNAIKQALKQLYLSCIQTHQEKECGTVRVNRLMLFDNNEGSHNLIFNVKPQAELTEEFDSAIERSFQLEGSMSGGRNTKKNGRLRKRKKTVLRSAKRNRSRHFDTSRTTQSASAKLYA